ncbi:MAG TPA: SDR family oxidoreductase [Thermoanaerobaculia bacterium]|nr:SDR family oxidoreductase [Thermoanaerobaculia bacterium]
MKPELKKIEDQVIVITGATSGIGLATAAKAAAKGARVVLLGTQRDAVNQVQEQVNGASLGIEADVTDLASLRRAAAIVEERFGGFDTWVNNAGVSVYGRIEDVPLDEARRLFDVDYWGVVHGSLVATEHLRRRGGALINVGSVLSDVGFPLQGHYAAAKHAVKGFTDSLRMELERQDAPVSVTLVKPASIDTPYPQHAGNHMDAEPTLPPPVYAPEVVARAILHCAEHPTRDLLVGGAGRVMTALGNNFPRLADRYFESAMADQQKADGAPASPGTTLYGDVPHAGERRGRVDGHVMKSSLYTEAVTHPGTTLALLGAATLGVMAAMRS